MILGFKKQFVPKILSGEKIHTIRKDVHDRWKPENKIHYATGTRTKEYNQFKEGKCISTQALVISYDYTQNHNIASVLVYVDGRLLDSSEVLVLAKNDGFDSLEKFFEWFNQNYKGKIIHWTPFRY